MELRFFAFALTLLLLIPGTVLSEETTRQSKVRAVQRAAQQQQAAERAQRCADAVSNAQGAEVGTSVLSGAIGLLPFGSAASSVAANVGTAAAGEIVRQKAAAAVQGNCGG
jgi:hypothetical protein